VNDPTTKDGWVSRSNFMKVILEFDGIEEQEAYNNALNGTKYRSLLYDITRMIRSKEKYLDEDTITLDELRQFIFDKANEYEVSI
jgi:hypothetical protein